MDNILNNFYAYGTNTIMPTNYTYRYISVATVVILILDYLETLELEIKHVWTSKGLAGRTVFFLNRYLPFVDVSLRVFYHINPNLSPRSCIIMDHALNWLMSFGILSSEAIPLLRTSALYNMRHIIFVLLAAFLICLYIATAVILVVVSRSAKYVPSPLSSHGCFGTISNKVFFTIFILLLLNEAVTLTLTMWKEVQESRHKCIPLAFVLYRDGVVYLAFIVATSISYLVIITLGFREYAGVLVVTLRMMHSILASRIILHVRRIASEGRGNDKGMGVD